jgi:hypothetical protein
MGTDAPCTLRVRNFTFDAPASVNHGVLIRG